MLQGCRNPHKSVELKRLVLQSKGRGLGRQCVRLRESVRVSGDAADGYDTLIVMSLLDRAYQARQALGLEGAGA